MRYASQRFFFVNENNRLKEKEKKNNVNVIELTTPCIWTSSCVIKLERKRVSPAKHEVIVKISTNKCVRNKTIIP